ncbi:MAG: monovalent cation/H+ antiporter subunit D [Burkholderiales bacterium]|nr:monovalent cation/H+ antiporter subunit D [Burkholderiales bacterium]
MSHWIVVPFLLPALTACVLLALRGNLPVQRVVSVVSTFVLLAVSAGLVAHASGGDVLVYAFGDWPARIGIAFVLDRLAALMIGLAAVVACASLLYAIQGWDSRGPHFHALFQFQLMGLNGAFLTGDLFNLFVCFELMLIASYALLQHGGGAQRLKAGLHYVVLNLLGSALFLVAAAILYRVGGTLNMADLAIVLAGAPPEHAPWIRAGALLLLAVFLLKAAAAPLYLWLPGTYGAASAPVACLFTVLTKVGVYAVARVALLVFGSSAAMEPIATVVLPAALVSLVCAALGAFAAVTLTQLASWLALGSSAMLLAAVGLFSVPGLSGGLYYLLASTLAVPALFLLADALAGARGSFGDRLCRAPRMHGAASIGALYFTVAVAVAGLPPLAGFLGKLSILQGAGPLPWFWAIVLGTSLLNLVALVRAGTRLFWSTDSGPGDGLPSSASMRRLGPVAFLVTAILALTILARPVDRYTREAAHNAVAPVTYIESVLGSTGVGWSIEIDPAQPQGGSR